MSKKLQEIEEILKQVQAELDKDIKIENNPIKDASKAILKWHIEEQIEYLNKLKSNYPYDILLKSKIKELKQQLNELK